MEGTLKIGIFGGTFDPIHKGHLQIALAVKRKLKLDRVIFVVSYKPPHKREKVQTSFSHRFSIVKLALKNEPSFEASDIEKRLGGTSYTVRTLRYLRRALPNAKLYLIIGADSLSELSTWRDLPGILRIADIITFPRKGFSAEEVHRLHNIIGPTEIKKIKEGIIKAKVIDISSTDIRSRLSKGKSISHLVSPAVAQYLRQHPEIYTHK